jgi:hypothetical protein
LGGGELEEAEFTALLLLKLETCGFGHKQKRKTTVVGDKIKMKT